jgi:hypothetical protein
MALERLAVRPDAYAKPVAVAVHLKDVDVVGEAVEAGIRGGEEPAGTTASRFL